MDNETNWDGQESQNFEHLLESHRGILFKVANTYCWHVDDRADLIQDMAAQLWRAWPSFDNRRSFSTWMYRIALNIGISYVRANSIRQRHQVSLTDEHHDVPAPESDEIAYEVELKRNLLQAFIERQPLLDRALLLLYLDARPQKEMAEILGLNESNVSTKISRLKQRLRNEI